jgi:chromosome segregation protein
MYLEKLSVQGFKSFANKNELTFVGMLNDTKRGLTAVVGPNGSGKSNVADAIRWALGEQSMKSLRGKKSEDVIFSGSDKKGKLGMAEVSLHLNNEDRKAPIDYSQLVITRRLFRNGDSEYLINNSRVRLSDVQMLLAKAKFGQKTYSVIGQGTVEGFLSASLSERKEFFDEATGVKQFQIKRDDALNKLKASYENLNQAEMILVEIEPRLKSLTRQVNKIQRKEELEKELRSLSLVYYRNTWHKINDEFSDFNKRYLEIEKEKNTKEDSMKKLNQNLAVLESENTVSEEFNQLQRDLNKLQIEKNDLNKKIARLEVENEVDLESSGQFDLSFLTGRVSDMKKEIESLEEEILFADTEAGKESQGLEEFSNKKRELDKKINDINNRIFSFSSSPKNKDGDDIKNIINSVLNKLKEAEESEDFAKVKEILVQIKNDLKKVVSTDEDDEEKVKFLSEARAMINKYIEEKEVVLSRVSEINLLVASKRERASLKKEKLSQLKNELSSLKERIDQSANKLSSSEIAEALNKFSLELQTVDSRINEVKKKIENISQAEEEKRSKLFSLQRSIQSLQNEINIITNKLNEVKINATRRETKLEDLEVEIRQNLGGMREVRDTRAEGHVELEELKNKISNTRKHLEHIGGIDPEVENEFISTKERYDFISGQVTDLVDAIGSLEKIIKELDITIKEIFDKEFKIIQTKFEEYFKILFSGGKARIIKVMEKDEDPSTSSGQGEEEEKKEVVFKSAIDAKKIKFLQKHNATGLAGIEIQATPPGKKISSISMLSGGERALTAIALISAIISANPSPFVVLDEVDAALDEANSERLAEILDDLSHKTQFIVITHNRASMRRASILYGVTMGDDGVSKLLSVKLEEAKAVDKQ